MNDDSPRVSIGLPVFNGQNYIKEALDSILAQAFSGFELIIVDDCSTDGTREICQAYAARDRRIRYYRNEENLGLVGNFNRAFALSTGEYFKWAAHDDIIASDYLSRCVEVLDRDPSVVLCHSKARRIDAIGQVIGTFDTDADRMGSPKPQIRFGYLLLTDRWPYEIFGLIRADTLEQTRLYGDYAGTDVTLRAELGLLGRFYELPEYLFFFREHAEQTGVKWVDPANTGRFAFTHWRLLLEYARSVRRASLSGSERVWCYLHTARWVGVNRNWGRMMLDVIVAAAPGFWSLYARLKRWFLRNVRGVVQ